MTSICVLCCRKALLKRAAVVKLSDDELEFLTGGTSTGDICSQLWHDGLKLVVLSLGAQGSIAITERGEQTIPSVPVKVVDTTGAGDGFVAGCYPALPTTPKSSTMTMRSPNCAVLPMRWTR